MVRKSPLARQTDAKLQITSFVFDALGRTTQRLEPDLDSRWVFDTPTTGIGKLAEAYTRRGDGSKDCRRVHGYDSLSRPSSTTLTLDQDYTTGYEYNAKHVVHESSTWADVRERDEEFQRKLG
jgi:hypothetical protein